MFFCTNDLALTSSKNILLSESDEAIKAMNGMSCIYRWMGNENLAQKPFLVPNVVIAYNNFIGRN